MENKFSGIKKPKPVFTKVEIMHLQLILYFAELKGEYKGQHDAYTKRANTIKNKLNNLLKDIL